MLIYKAMIKLKKYGHEFCGPCRVIKPILEELASDYKDNVEYEDIDTYQLSVEELTLAGIRAVPTIIIEKNGTEMWRNIGLVSKERIKTEIDKLL